MFIRASKLHNVTKLSARPLNSNLNGKLSASGGKITSALTTDGNAIRSTNTAGSVNFMGGTSFSNGANLILRGKDQTGINGKFELSANNGSTSAALIGNPDGTLTYADKKVVLEGSSSVEFTSANQGGVYIFCDNEGGNIRLRKITSDNVNPHLELDTFAMNGTSGCARMYLGTDQNEATTGFYFNEDGSFSDGNGYNTTTLGQALSKIPVFSLSGTTLTISL